MKSVTLSLLQKQLRRKVRNRNTPSFRKNLKLVSEYCKKWGSTTVVHEDPDLRASVADSISIRLGLPRGFVIDRLNQFHRMAHYE